MERVLDALVFEGRLEKAAGADGGSRWRLGGPGERVRPGLAAAPCAVCPVADDCGPGRAVSPATCQYFKEWLA